MLPINVKWEFSENRGELIAQTIPIDTAQINGNANNPNGLHQDTNFMAIISISHLNLISHKKQCNNKKIPWLSWNNNVPKL